MLAQNPATGLAVRVTALSVAGDGQDTSVKELADGLIMDPATPLILRKVAERVLVPQKSSGVLVEVAMESPAADCPKIIDPAAMMKDSHHAEAARRFLVYLAGVQADDIFAKFGFVVIE